MSNYDEIEDDNQEYCDEDELQYWKNWARALDDLDEGGDGGDYFWLPLLQHLNERGCVIMKCTLSLW